MKWQLCRGLGGNFDRGTGGNFPWNSQYPTIVVIKAVDGISLTVVLEFIFRELRGAVSAIAAEIRPVVIDIIDCQRRRPDGGLRLGGRGREQAERPEQQREDGEAGGAAPGAGVRPGRRPCRGSRLARAGQAPGARHAAGRWPLAAGRWPLAAGRWPLAAGRWPLAAGKAFYRLRPACQLPPVTLFFPYPGRRNPPPGPGGPRPWSPVAGRVLLALDLSFRFLPVWRLQASLRSSASALHSKDLQNCLSERGFDRQQAIFEAGPRGRTVV